MIACVSPSRMVRLTPFRISFGPSSVFTETCRSLISSVAMSVVSQGIGRLQVDQYVVTGDLHRKDRNGFGRRRTERLAGAQVEAGAVHPALDLAPLDVALGQG